VVSHKDETIGVIKAHVENDLQQWHGFPPFAAGPILDKKVYR